MNLRTMTPPEIDTKIAALETRLWTARAARVSAIDMMHAHLGDRKQHLTRSVTRWVKYTDEQAIDDARQIAANEIPVQPWERDYLTRDVARFNDAETTITAVTAELEPYEAEYRRRPWSRFFQLRSTAGARIHATGYCQGLHRSDPGDLGWHPELSGKTEADAVAELGPVMCSKCFKSAPLDWRQDPKNLKVDPDRCPGTDGKPVEGTVDGKVTINGYSQWGDCPACGKRGVQVKQNGKLAKHKKPKN